MLWNYYYYFVTQLNFVCLALKNHISNHLHCSTYQPTSHLLDLFVCPCKIKFMNTCSKRNIVNIISARRFVMLDLYLTLESYFFQIASHLHLELFLTFHVLKFGVNPLSLHHVEPSNLFLRYSESTIYPELNFALVSFPSIFIK